MSGLGLPPEGTYQGVFPHPATGPLHVPPPSGFPTWGKGWITARSTLQRAPPREVTHVLPKSHIPLLRADVTWGNYTKHPAPLGERKLHRIRRHEHASQHASPIARASSSRLRPTENRRGWGLPGHRSPAPGPPNVEVDEEVRWDPC